MNEKIDFSRFLQAIRLLNEAQQRRLLDFVESMIGQQNPKNQ